jgi:aspartyl-tRNA(Asn)/glutamyl-tRNA(Gln) amidotransferase subunit B
MQEKSYPIKIGLEVHGYLNTNEKLFCKCKTGYDLSLKDNKPNTRICPICTGQPGSKPMLPNKEAFKKLIQTSLLLNCKINSNKKLIWYRKHYNWADLPKGYQNTISGSFVTPCSEDGEFENINIIETHLEEDPAQWNPDTGKIDYNRSGLPLIEIVTHPDFKNEEQVENWLRNLLHSLSYIKALRKDAGIKCDVNISTYGDRVEIKNLNSIEKIKKAIRYEIQKQIENHEKGIEQKRETLAFDEKSGITIKMRSKENAQDYRFIPEPDLPPITIEEKEVEKIKSQLPETPNEKLEKLLKKYKLDSSDAKVLTKNLELVDFFEELSKEVDAKKYISWITIELLRILNYNKTNLDEVNIKPIHLAELIKEVDSNNITVLKAKQIMNEFIPESFSIKQKSGQFSKISQEEIENICKKVIEENPKAVDDFKQGNDKSLNFLVGAVMRLSNRRADFNISKEYLIKILK